MDHSNPSGNAVDLPSRTIWPLVFALGVALIFTGFISSKWVSIVGAALWLAASVGWWLQVLPTEHHVHVPVEGVPEQAEPAEIEVQRIRVGEKGHRVAAPRRIRPFSAGFKGGMVGALAMAGVAMFFGIVSQGSVWYPINLLAAAAVPDLASASVETLRQFSATGLILGIVIHFLTSYLVGVIYAVMLPMFPRGAFWWAGVSAPVVWSGVIATTMELVNPALNARIDWKWFVASQLAFGLTGGYVIARSEQIEARENVPLPMRAGIEAPGVHDVDNKR
ncbi:MAG TPA: hypothetical protein VEF06_15345 [Bryobacteraceae bacterium]|nr:hypothetical protein [Bryobacteraceae bacterium]